MEEEIIVPTNINYTSCLLMNNIEQLKRKYKFISTGIIGYSVLGKPIPYIRLGIGVKEVMYAGSFHANEWITSVVLMKFVEDYAKSYEQNGVIYGYNTRELYNNTSIYIVPMVNPDGVDLVTGVIPEPRPCKPYPVQHQQEAIRLPGVPLKDGWSGGVTRRQDR